MQSHSTSFPFLLSQACLESIDLSISYAIIATTCHPFFPQVKFPIIAMCASLALSNLAVKIAMTYPLKSISTWRIIVVEFHKNYPVVLRICQIVSIVLFLLSRKLGLMAAFSTGCYMALASAVIYNKKQTDMQSDRSIFSK